MRATAIPRASLQIGLETGKGRRHLEVVGLVGTCAGAAFSIERVSPSGNAHPVLRDPYGRPRVVAYSADLSYNAIAVR
jgi:hypothetical protein